MSDLEEETRDLIVDPELQGNLPALAGDVLRGARKIIDEGTPPNTKRAYKSDMAYVKAWAIARGFDPELPYSAELMVTFIVDHLEQMPSEVERVLVADRVKADFGPQAISTVKRRVATISVAHKIAGLPTPTANSQVSELMSRASKAAARRGWRPNKKAAIDLEWLNPILDTCDGRSLHDIRDRAMILFAWASGGRRRSEVASATIERLQVLGDDYVYELGVTKNTQTGETGVVPVAGRAADAMRDWLDRLRKEEGPLFRGILPNGVIMDTPVDPDTVNQVIKRRAKLAGLDVTRIAAHSLRAGFMTEAGKQNVNLKEAMELSTHKSMTVAGEYFRASDGLKNRGARLAG